MLGNIPMLLRRIIPLFAILLCGLWLLAAYCLVPDQYGYNVVAAILGVDVLILIFAITCVIFSAHRLLSWSLALSLLSVAPLHYWGSGVNAPACDLLFLPPLGVVFLASIWSFATAHMHRATA
ncbi:MAG: hypothetical protein ACAH88_11915 [Roseimicrobium sp.]